MDVAADIARDLVIDAQPILWAQGMLEEDERCTSTDARDAILTRVGATLLTRFGVAWDWNEMRRCDLPAQAGWKAT